MLGMLAFRPSSLWAKLYLLNRGAGVSLRQVSLVRDVYYRHGFPETITDEENLRETLSKMWRECGRWRHEPISLISYLMMSLCRYSHDWDLITVIGHGSARLRINLPHGRLARNIVVLRFAWMVCLVRICSLR